MSQIRTIAVQRDTTTSPQVETQKPTRVTAGFIGLDSYRGASMCTNLVKAGFATTIYDQNQGKCTKLSELGGRMAWSPKQVVMDSDVIFLSLGTKAQHRQ